MLPCSTPASTDAVDARAASSPQALRRLDRAATLRDGTAVRVRAIREDDREQLVAAFAHLDPDAVYTRFHGMKKSLSEDELRQLTRPDFDRSVVLVLELDDGEKPKAIAAASCYLLGEPGTGDAAEVSFTVDEAYRGRGAGSVMLAVFIDIARARGLRRLVAEVLALNAPMLAVFNNCGLPLQMVREDNVIHVTLSLTGEAPASPGPGS